MMPSSILNLTHVQYTQLDPATWCATAQVSECSSLNFKRLWDELLWSSANNLSQVDFQKIYELNWHYCLSPVSSSTREMAQHQRQLQRKGVRLLLQQLLDELKLRDTLDESNFPYRLSSSEYYVCFSHTGSKNHDMNQNTVQTINKSLNSKVTVVISRHRPIGIDIETNHVAWRVAQRFYSEHEMAALQALFPLQRKIIAKLLWQIKESFIKIHQYKLAQGLGVDYSYLIADLIHAIREPSSLMVIADIKSDYRIAVLSAQQTIVIF
ncbi:4'-phosphopantetheinyl transferase superfamily protein [Psychrobacter cibarius]|uniref:4'-phosphopantetheinyl transferase superfamily protein n=1 Tax=Psychrobacter cibarius TaxID=282669 RepID=UPI0018E02482|nr:4'-phosphopantetheinyl transferase superfamily protein [Psychrobacter cibarius]